ncbi:ABC-type antimicrobial peptide transport system permease subunit [Parabacteroides sp. PF5-5]|uniref:ABC transporter permease n=1 Tax=unclassified Parabacteroides TaxID=2649774 RepID=UPI002474E2B6|nr:MULTISPECIES: ABC transporter permease [unclassified Parabacteroides]MDH6303498.1 ABC-type antimicrobial peptide transport system permease subunit [Parabacteroides sp. PH5-39]MDH6314820.1 ABC-type antimicrobial peptide transport system permease subunit [Parabacteroides sp. PF5-13]MDH6318157.1 ABC-type antimicrobial peptide transport system permease subunit [Parabacteroides sp. PH5-13]MDH6321911.1 ABC-type antimicrobial peptide transport system permease subunit [Parabacteroides sp. PH5-8]MDH
MKVIQLGIRSLLRFRLYTTVNILGLALALACFILIFRYVYSEYSTDHYIKDIGRVCFLTYEEEQTHNVRITGSGKTAGWMSPNPLEDKDVEMMSVFYPFDGQIMVNEQSYSAASFAADTNFFKLLTLPILKTNGSPLLARPDEVIVSEELADKLFAKADPIGQTIVSSKGDLLTVTGVFGKPRTKISFSFDMVESSHEEDDKLVGSYHLVLLRKGCDVKALNARYDQFKKIGEEDRYKVQFFPLKKLYFDNQLITFLPKKVTGNITYLLLLFGVALLILFIGLFNFVNIYTVLMLKRAREFGMKKVFGANKRQLAMQLYAENIVMTGIALFIAWVLVELGSLLFHAYIGLPTRSSFSFNILLSVGILFILPLVTSLYPYIRYMYASPITSIRSVNRAGASVVSRSLFLCCQYTITIALIISSLFFIRQLNFMMNMDLGYETENIIKIPPLRSPNSNSMDAWNEYFRKMEYVEKALKESPLVLDYAFANTPSNINSTPYSVYVPGKERMNISADVSSGSQFRILGFKPKVGRIWDDSIDSFEDFNVIINESAKAVLGITDIDKATVISDGFFVWYSGIDKDRRPEYRVIGVIEDFNTGHLSKAVPPLIFYYYKHSQASLLVKIIPDKKQETISWLRQVYGEISGDTFSYQFLEDEVKALYDSDRMLTHILTFFSIIAILISSMGLFSLSLFDIQQRYHEIAIRKVNGASSGAILLLLLRKYYLLLGLAFLIAAPISWLAITKYLEGFAHKASIAWWLFVVAFIVTAAISLLTLIIQITKAANTDPSKVIRAE